MLGCPSYFTRKHIKIIGNDLAQLDFLKVCFRGSPVRRKTLSLVGHTFSAYEDDLRQVYGAQYAHAYPN